MYYAYNTQVIWTLQPRLIGKTCLCMATFLQHDIMLLFCAFCNAFKVKCPVSGAEVHSILSETDEWNLVTLLVI